MAGLVQPDTEVIRFDISVNEVPIMDVLNSLNHLVNQYEDGFE